MTEINDSQSEPTEPAPVPPKPESALMPEITANDILLGNEIWCDQFPSNVPGLFWGVVKDNFENKTYLLIAMANNDVVEQADFATLKLDSLEWVFKETKIDEKVYFLGNVKIGGRALDIIMRIPVWTSSKGTTLYTDDNVKEPVLGKSGMTISLMFPSSTRHMFLAMKETILPIMLANQRALLWFPLVRNPTDADIANDKAEMVKACKFDPNSGLGFVTLDADTSTTPVTFWKGALEYDDLTQMCASEYMSYPVRLLRDLFGNQNEVGAIYNGQNKTRMLEGQLKNATGLMDLSMRYHVGKDQTIYNPKEKCFTLKFKCRRFMIDSIKPHVHLPIQPVQTATISRLVGNVFNTSSPINAIENKRALDDAMGDIEEPSAKRLKTGDGPLQIEDKSGN